MKIKRLITNLILSIFISLLMFISVKAEEIAWRTLTDSFGPRAYFGTGVVNNKIYVIGGEYINPFYVDCVAVGTVQEYDPISVQWRIKTSSVPDHRTEFTAGVVNNRIYCIGGGGEYIASCTPGPLVRIDEYDPVLDVFNYKSNISTSRRASATAVVNSKIYAVGGWIGNSNGISTNTVEEYDPVADMCTIKANMLAARASFGVGVVNNMIYAVGGDSLSTVDEYDPVADTWTRKSSMLTPRTNFALAVVNNKIYVIGGLSKNDGIALSTVEEYDPLSNTWSTKNYLSTPRYGHRAEVVNGKIYVLGGYKTHIDSMHEELNVYSIEEGIFFQSNQNNQNNQNISENSAEYHLGAASAIKKKMKELKKKF